jgi:GGDEF domain-containing protein
VAKHHRGRKHDRHERHASAPAATDGPDPSVSLAGSDAVRRSTRPSTVFAALDRSARPARSAEARRAGSTGTLVERLTWERLVADESERQRRYGRPSAIVLAEVHGLDRAVAQAGPRAVDRVAPSCGRTLVSIARGSDRVTRLTDGRFGILLREADDVGASRYAGRARAACDGWLAAMPWPLELQIGWASPEGNEDLVGALRRAERDLGTGRRRPSGTP